MPLTGISKLTTLHHLVRHTHSFTAHNHLIIIHERARVYTPKGLEGLFTSKYSGRAAALNLVVRHEGYTSTGQARNATLHSHTHLFFFCLSLSPFFGSASCSDIFLCLFSCCFFISLLCRRDCIAETLWVVFYVDILCCQNVCSREREKEGIDGYVPGLGGPRESTKKIELAYYYIHQQLYILFSIRFCMSAFFFSFRQSLAYFKQKMDG